MVSGCLSNPFLTASCDSISRMTMSSRTILRKSGESACPWLVAALRRMSTRACGMTTPFTVAAIPVVAGLSWEKAGTAMSAPAMASAANLASFSIRFPYRKFLGLHFIRRIGADIQGVDVVPHYFMQRGIYHAVPLQGRFSDELRRYDGQAVVAAGTNASVSGMQAAVVGDVELRWLQCGQMLTNPLDAVHVGKVFLNGLTVTSAYIPAAT